MLTRRSFFGWLGGITAGVAAVIEWKRKPEPDYISLDETNQWFVLTNEEQEALGWDQRNNPNQPCSTLHIPKDMLEGDYCGISKKLVAKMRKNPAGVIARMVS